MLVLEAGLCVALVALIVVLVIRERDHDRTVARLEDAARLERVGLYQRIQAPEVAVMDYSMDKAAESPRAVLPDDDHGFWESQMTKEQLAEALLEAERSR